MSNFWTGARLARLPRYVFEGILGITVVVFAVVACVVGFERAWEVLIGVKAPFGKDRGFEVALSLLGYVFVPTAIALAVTDSIVRFQRQRLISLSEAHTIIGEIVQKAEDSAVDDAGESQVAQPDS
jgi:hypothetical protein